MTRRAIAIPQPACYTATEGCGAAPYPGNVAECTKEMRVLVIPTALLRRFYVEDTLRNTDQGVEFRLKNRVAPTTLVAVGPLEIDGTVVPPERVMLQASKTRSAVAVGSRQPLQLPMGRSLTVKVAIPPLARGSHHLRLHVVTREVGPVVIEFSDTV
ncbi:MAG: hypothetical protein NZP34_02190 [Caldilineales bacterium]|nr:hypothetical protein [Caldilineales bacterium]